jgi:hypothetical protein
MMSHSNFKQYIGDSVYADFDGFHIILTTENGLPGDPSNRIALEPEMPERLKQYLAWAHEKAKEMREGNNQQGEM